MPDVNKFNSHASIKMPAIVAFQGVAYGGSVRNRTVVVTVLYRNLVCYSERKGRGVSEK